VRTPSRIFAPGFGAGAVAGYAIMRVDPAVVAVQSAPAPQAAQQPAPAATEPEPGELPKPSDDVGVAFG
jgi:3-oxoacyl-[acyl-carrier-protein] synthase III